MNTASAVVAANQCAEFAAQQSIGWPGAFVGAVVAVAVAWLFRAML